MIVKISVSLIMSVISCPTSHKNVDFSPRIIGGSLKDIKQYPFVVALAHATDDGIRHLVCGGSIISKRWAVSAYHCLYYFWNLNLFTEDMFLLSNATVWKNGTVHKVVKYIVNKKVKQIQNFDILLLKVFEPFSGVYEKPITVASHNYIYKPKSVVTVIGWGLSNADNVLPEKELRAVNLAIYSNKKCKQTFAKLKVGEKHEITDRMVCAGPVQSFEKSDACQLDSGGPLLDGDVLVGIVSWGTDCGKGYPGVYVRLSKFEEWIHFVEKSEKEKLAKFKKVPHG